MVTMFPPYPREGANFSERSIYSALEGITDRPDWVVIHSLAVGQNTTALVGEADFVVLVPDKGIVVIEAKAPKSVEYKSGDWFLDHTPTPNKDPLKQLDGARRSIRGFLRGKELLDGREPIARLLWFTSLGRHQFENKTPSDLQFFEWELGWHDDLRKPAWLIEKALDEHAAWFRTVDEVEIEPAVFTREHAASVAEVLLGDFAAKQTPTEQKAERETEELKLLQEQRFALELVETNDHLYFDGPAGTGKSYLLVQAARRFSTRGKRTLVTCWNLLMADELRNFVSSKLDGIEVADLNSIMLSLCGLQSNPADAGSAWFNEELPKRALERLQEKPYLGDYEAICVDEFQDIAGNSLLLDVIFALAGTKQPEGTKLVFAGDERQQIMRTREETVSVYATAKARVSDLVHVRVRRNCRTVPAIISGAESILKQKLGFTGHRVSRSVPGGLETIEIAGDTEAAATSALARAIRTMLKHHDAQDIVVLSPFGETNSLVGRLQGRSEKSQDERWLRKQLVSAGQSGRVRWRSIFKYKGLEADAVILTDLDDTARSFIASSGLDWDDLLYVGLTRAKYRCVVLAPPSSV